MKKSLLIFSALPVLAFSQNRHINFETGNLASVFEKAKKENKFILVDAYTTWCGPCKWMSKNIFTNDTAADYYNANFVNLKIDAEKGEGIAFAEKYDVRCYPNFLILDGDGKVIHRVAGSMPTQAFVSFGKTAFEKEKTFSFKKSEFEKFILTEQNVTEYIDLLMSCCLDPSARALEYIASVKEADLTKENNWTVLRDFVYNHESREMKYFLSNLNLFEKSFGKDAVVQKLEQLGKSYFSKYTRAKEFDKSGYENAKKEFANMKWPNTDKIIFEADMEAYKRFDNTKYYELAASDFQKHYNNDSQELNGMAWNFYEKVSDKKLLGSAVKMAQRACEINASYANLDTYAAVLYKSGDFKNAETQANKAIEKAKSENMGADDYKETSELLKKIKSGK